MNSSNQKTVLIVNDSPDQGEMTRVIFQQAGYRVIAASDGREGFRLAKRERLDLIISDVTMPVADGIELCRLIRADEKLHSLPILLVSALRKNVSHMVEGLEVGADDYIELPIAPLHLIARAERLLERKRMEDLLRESEAKFRKVLENSRDIIYQFNLHTKSFDYMSPAAKELSGYSAEEYLKGGFFFSNSLVHPKDLGLMKNRVKEALRSADAKKTHHTIEYRLKTKEKGYRWISENRAVVSDENNVPAAIIATARDVTEQKQAEATLHFQTTLLQSQSEASLDGILVVNPAGEIISYNQRFADLWSLSEELMTTKSREEILRASFDQIADRRGYLKIIAYLNRHPHETCQTDVLLKDGRILDLYTAPVVDGNNTHYGRVWFFHDITERRRVEELIRQSGEKYRTILESIEEGYYEIDLAGNYTFFNNALCASLGYDPHEMLGMNYREYSDAETAKKLFTLFNGIYTTGRPLSGSIYEVIRKDGTRRIHETSGSLMRDRAGEPVGFRGLLRDVTERQRIENDLRESEERYRVFLSQSSEAIWRFETEPPCPVDIPVDEQIEWLYRCGYLAECNDAMAQMYGYESAAEITGARVGDMLPQSNPANVEYLRNFINSGYKLSGSDSYEIDKDGNPRVFSNSLSGVVEDNRVMRVWGVQRDVTEQRRVETKLRRSETNLAAAQRITHLGSWEVELSDLRRVNNNQVHWSDEVYRIFGHEPGAIDVSINYYFDSIHPDDRKRCRRAFVEAVTEGKDLNIEFRTALPSESERVLHGRGEVIYDAQSNQPLKFIGTVQDITERKRQAESLTRANELLKRSEESYRIVAETASDVIVTIDERGTILFVNAAAQKVLGYEPQELIGSNLTTIMPERFHGAHHCGMSRYLRTGERGISWNGVEVSAVRRDGGKIQVEISFGEYREKDTHVFTGIIRDITERKEAEAAIAEANERAIREYERLIDRVAELAESLGTARDLQTIYRALYSFAVVSAPCTGFFISLHDAGRNVRLPGYAVSDGEEIDVSDLPQMEMSGSPNSRAISTGAVVIEDDFQSAMAGKPIVNIGLDKHPDLPQSCLVAPMSVMGRIVGAVEVRSDKPAAYTNEHATAMRMAANLAANAIENVRLLEQEREHEERLRQSQKLESVGRLAGGIAHDFNNMLTAINGYSELTLRKLDADSPLRRNVEEIKKAGERSAALTHQLLAFSRQQVLQSRVLDLNEIINDTIQLLQRLIGANIRLDTSLDSKLGRVEADPGQLSQVLMNLAVNARDAMTGGGNLTIETTNIHVDKEYVTQNFSVKPGSYVLLAVNDTGTGIDAETQRHIFEPFFTTKEIGKGTGLGLATVYGIVKQSGGYIWVYSEVGHGTSFKIYLPRIDEEIAAETEDGESVKAPQGAETILIVEDEDMVRALTRQILEESGYQVVEACNGVEALSICEQQIYKIDLLMTDVVMPQMGGRELAEKLARIQPDLRVLFTSGYTDDQVIRHNVIEADTNFIQKPFTFDDLAHKIREVLDKEN